MSTLATNNIVPATGSTVSIPAFAPSVQMGNKNKIINGKMEIAQRGTSFAAIATETYSVDRWIYNNTSAAVVTASQQSDVPSNNEFQNSLRLAVTTADTSIAAGDFSAVTQRIEGYNVRDLIGRTFTLSFWVRSSKTGTHCVAFRNGTTDRSYIMEYTVSAANTWEYKTLSVSGGLITAGTWNWTNAHGLSAWFILAAGTNFQTTANAWNTGNFLATANQVNCLDTVGNIFAITGVQLEVGSVATPFEHRPYGAELALCQRYYETGDIGNAWSYDTTTNGRGVLIFFQTSKRAAPTITKTTGGALLGGGFSLGSGLEVSKINGFTLYTAAAGAVREVGFSFTASAEL